MASDDGFGDAHTGEKGWRRRSAAIRMRTTKAFDLFAQGTMLRKLAYIDVPELLKPSFTPLAAQVLFGVALSGFAVALRVIIDLVLPGAGPFGLMVPAVLVATLFGRWLAGLVCLAITSLHAWYFVLPISGSFSFIDPGDGPRVIVNVLSGAFVVALAELFRRTMRQALTDREMLLLEVEHRVKNNFASVASLLRLQMRKAKDAETHAALHAALGRVESFALANSFLYRTTTNVGTVDMRTYLHALCRSLEGALPDRPKVAIRPDADQCELPRDRAIVIGLLVNETATNSVKHAFNGRKEGTIDVVFRGDASGCRLEVRDDGSGMPDEKRDGSLGLSLIEALAQQADGAFDVASGADGTAYVFTFNALACPA